MTPPAVSPAGRPAIFLDRDGTIIVERDYLSDPDAVALESGAAEGLRRMAELGWPLVVISNQSGVGRGYFDDRAVERVNARVAERLAAEGVTVAGWYYCPHAPAAACACRKPRDGLVRAAAADLGLDCTRSFVIGDKLSDVELAHAVGATGILVTTGHGAAVDVAAVPDAIVCRDLTAAAEAVHRSVKGS